MQNMRVSIARGLQIPGLMPVECGIQRAGNIGL
jgi:hypothetical protein